MVERDVAGMGKMLKIEHRTRGINVKLCGWYKSHKE